LVTLAWVFFRAPTLTAAIGYFQSMLAYGHPSQPQLMATGLVYQPYYVLTLLIAALVVWKCRQAWDVTRNLTWPVAMGCASVFWISIALLFAQSYNPFIYYIF